MKPNQDGGINCFNSKNKDLVFKTKYGKEIT